MPGSVSDRLVSTRRAALVGRDQELDTLLIGLGDPCHVFTYVHGPGGVGKTALLQALDWEAGRVNSQPVWVDCADCEPTVDRLTRAVAERAEVAAVSDLAADTRGCDRAPGPQPACGRRCRPDPRAGAFR